MGLHLKGWQRRQLTLAAFALGLFQRSAIALDCHPRQWPLWQRFRQQFIQADGRVIDHSVGAGLTTSEGQSYAMFFALVNNDRNLFDTLWRWSVANLAQGSMSVRLPAWSWGRNDKGEWGVLDENAASDADCWFAYALLEAGRLWGEPSYTASARALMLRIEQEEVADLPGLGKMLLPGPKGFIKADNLWRLNPSYLPIMLLRRFAQVDASGPWADIVRSTAALHQSLTDKGIAPDWIAYLAEGQGGRFIPDPDSPPVSSYDAIRTYLWAGMLHPRDEHQGLVLRSLSGMSQACAISVGQPPEKLQVATAEAQGAGPVGFSAALLPYFKTLGQSFLYQFQLRRVENQLLSLPGPAYPPYYDHVLGLFGTGWNDGRYAFDVNGTLKPDWEATCPSKPAR